MIRSEVEATLILKPNKVGFDPVIEKAIYCQLFNLVETIR